MVTGACGLPQKSHPLDTPTIVPIEDAHALYFYSRNNYEALYLQNVYCGMGTDENPTVLCAKCARKLGYVW